MKLIENIEHVVSDLIDGEMVLLHMGAGNYYSMGGAGVELWSALQCGCDTSELLTGLTGAFPQTPHAQLEEELEHWLKQLQDENLVVEWANQETEGTSIPEFKEAYQPPEVTRYSDLQDLLLLDPVHDADPEVGWPAQKS